MSAISQLLKPTFRGLSKDETHVAMETYLQKDDYVYIHIQICVAKQRGYVLRNASLGDFVFVRTCTYTNLDTVVQYSLLHT